MNLMTVDELIRILQRHGTPSISHPVYIEDPHGNWWPVNEVATVYRQAAGETHLVLIACKCEKCAGEAQ